MAGSQEKQHRRILILNAAVIYLTAITVWQNTEGFLEWGKITQFSPDNSAFVMAVALFSSLIAGLIFVRNSSRELKDSSRLAFVDDLTGIANRRQFNVRLEQELARAARHQRSVGVLYFDLDRFKEINDCYGHEVGDKVIVEFGRRLTMAARKEDFVARLSGDEFAAIVSDVKDIKDVSELADRVIEAMRQPITFGNSRLYVCVSAGATICKHGELGAAEIVRQADFALLRAKKDGRDQLKLFDPTMANGIRAKRELESDLREALVTNAFYLEYQPLVSQESHEVVGAEALIRWKHPKLGLITPEDFIPLAEEIGLIHELGEFILRSACKDFHDLDNLKLAVNVSPVQFQHQEFIENFRKILIETGFDPERLEVEITEGVFITDPEKTAVTIRQIREMGVTVALDDFGTGYSSMSYLKDMSLDRIKIDRSFISTMDQSAVAESLVSTMFSLGKSLELNVTVEGVETSEQVQQLEQFNCNEMQGFHFSRPVEIARLQQLFADDKKKREDISGEDDDFQIAKAV